MVRGVSRWELDEPLEAIDAQISVLRDAYDTARADQIASEELAVAADHVADRAHRAAATARIRARQAGESARDFAHELDELYTDRQAIVPGQRPPSAGS